MKLFIFHCHGQILVVRAAALAEAAAIVAADFASLGKLPEYYAAIGRELPVEGQSGIVEDITG